MHSTTLRAATLGLHSLKTPALPLRSSTHLHRLPVALNSALSKRHLTKSSYGPPIPAAFGPPGAGPTTYFQKPSLPANTIIRFVPQQTAWIVERMGKFNRILEPGLAILIPFLDRIAYVKSLKEVALEIPSQSAITADNVTLELDGVLYTRVIDAYKARLVIHVTEFVSHTI
jgi:SPFH domain / Band 7 family